MVLLIIYRRCNNRFVSVIVTVSLNHFDGDDDHDGDDDDCDDNSKCVFNYFHRYDFSQCFQITCSNFSWS